ncbi:Epoxyqueuosine (oQ) reductase QueG [Clostridiaceae bacterium JG1575]|nr:Epoxyqueuosine (oQ) reductase QueG [Clostridiaceae bacterium JG1575]
MRKDHEPERNQGNPKNPGEQQKLYSLLNAMGLKVFGVTTKEAVLAHAAYYKERPTDQKTEFEASSGDLAKDLQAVVPDGSKILSIAFPYAHDLNWEESHFSIYARSLDYHEVLTAYLARIAQWITDEGYCAQTFRDSNPLPERLIACLAGVGYVGRNNTLITKDYGSFVFLGEVVTDYPLRPSSVGRLPGDHSLCGSCRACQKACPAGILIDGFTDSSRCLSYVSQKKELAEEEIQKLQGRLFGCDTCLRVCPKNQGRSGTGLPEFQVLEYMAHPDLLELAQLSRATFREKYAITSAGWRGKTVLARNALIALSATGKLPEDLRFSSPVLQREYDKIKKLSKEKTKGRSR